MKDYKLPARKPDLLDELNTLRRRRGIAYRAGNIKELDMIHLEMKAFWLRNGWSEEEATHNYLDHVKECIHPFIMPQGNLAITHIVTDKKSRLPIHLKSIAELSKYWVNEN